MLLMTPASKTKHLVMPNAAIDLGFFQVKTASGRGTSKSGSEILKDIFPSFAPLIDEETRGLMSLSARTDSGVAVEVNGMSYFVGESSHRMFGSAGNTRASNERYCLTPSYKALFLGALWQIAKRHGVECSLNIKHLVLGLPLTTLVEHNGLVQEMARGTHVIPSPFSPTTSMKVTVEEAMVVAQPQGGIVSYANGEGRNLVKPQDDVLVLDMGGGTFDWFVCDGEFQPSYKVCGALPLGTLNCAAAILQSIKPTLANSPKAMNRVDMALRSNSGSFDLGGESYEIDRFTKQVNALVSGAIEQMQTKVGELGTLDHILLTGGGAGLLKRVCDEALKSSKKVIRMDPDPVYSNVDGFFIISEMATA